MSADAAGASELILRPIGLIRTPFATTADCPRNGLQLDPPPRCTVEIFPEHVAALRDLDGFSHLILIWWLHLAGPAPPSFVPKFDGQPRGALASRTPRRPNPLGLSVVAFDGFLAPDRLAVRRLDCVDGTPLLDLKPYLPTTDSEPEARMGWLAPHATRGRS